MGMENVVFSSWSIHSTVYLIFNLHVAMFLSDDVSMKTTTMEGLCVTKWYGYYVFGKCWVGC